MIVLSRLYLVEQEAQLSQRNRATLRVIEYFAKSFKVIALEMILLSMACVSGYYLTYGGAYDCTAMQCPG